MAKTDYTASNRALVAQGNVEDPLRSHKSFLTTRLRACLDAPTTIADMSKSSATASASSATNAASRARSSTSGK